MLLFYSVLSYIFLSYEKNLQKPFFPFNKKKQVLLRGIKKEKVVSKWPFQVYLERKLESVWSRESRFGISKHQSRLSFCLYVLIYSDTWSKLQPDEDQRWASSSASVRRYSSCSRRHPQLPWALVEGKSLEHQWGEWGLCGKEGLEVPCISSWQCGIVTFWVLFG